MANEVAVSIPYTKRHIKFIGEIQEALEAKGIKFDVEVDDGSESSQESWVRFSVAKAKVKEVRELVEHVSKNPSKVAA